MDGDKKEWRNNKGRRSREHYAIAVTGRFSRGPPDRKSWPGPGKFELPAPRALG
jgi:hypothetical protein